MNVLSLFDGISCGMVALDDVGIRVDRYYASEIDRYAEAVSAANYPQIIRLGDIRSIDYGVLPEIDLVIGGSPCQGFSTMANIRGAANGLRDDRSGLFYNYVDALRRLRPKYFLLENVVMKREWQDIISSELGVSPIMIDAAKISPTRRRRLYWTNIPVGELQRSPVSFDDIVQDENDWLDDVDAIPLVSKVKRFTGNRIIEIGKKNKIPCLTTHGYKRISYSIVLVKHEERYRFLSHGEAELAHGLPVGYTNHVSSAQRQKCIGNGWVVQVISHIFRGIKVE